MSPFPEEPLDLSAEQGFGYFPAYPGLTLRENRLRVIRKLGFGKRSSVWLTEDTQGTDGYQAVKILTVHATSQKTQELDALQGIKQPVGSDLPNLEGHFIEQSHHGSHQCIALTILGPDIDALRLTAPTKTLPIHIVQVAIVSIVNALTDLHSFGFLHGAVKPDNFLFFVGQNVEDIEPKLKTLPPSVIQRRVTVGGVEYPIVLSQPIPHLYKWNDDRSTITDALYLNNLAHAQAIKGNHTWDINGVDGSLRPPEVILGTDLNEKVDIWMIGCATYQLITGEALIPSNVTDHVQLERMIDLSGGSIKNNMALKSKRREEFFDEQGAFKNVTAGRTNLADELKATGKVADEDIPGIVQFIQTCLALDPADRPTADKLLKHEWLDYLFI